MTMARWQFSAADEQGNLLSQPTLRVRRRTYSGLQLEPLYWGPNGTEIGTNSSNLRGNPFTADAGEDPVFFHCVGGTFEITIAKGPYIKTWDYVLIGTAGGQDIPPIDWRGDWDPYTGYDVNNGVQSVGNGYVATAPSLGIQPGVTSGWESFWTKFVNKGDDGWSPVCAVTVDGARRVLKVVDWQGGEGSKPAIDKYVGATGLVDDVASAVDIRGGTGADGYDAWTPILAVVADSARRVLQIVDWAGGEGTKPTTGLYVGATGLEASIANGVDIRGAAGAIGGSTGAFDNRITRSDGTGGATLQDSAVVLDDQGRLHVPETTTPGTPGAGYVAIYTKNDHKLYKMDSTGTETEVGSGAGGGTPSYNGIQFPATQVPSSDPNCLDDYEETTWTPVIQDEAGSVTGVTYSSRTGIAIKIGKFIWYQCDIQLSNKGSGYTASSALRVNGLPYANGAGVFVANPCETDNITYASGRTFACLEPLAGATYCHLATSGTGVAHANAEGANLTNSSAVHASGVYSASA